MWGKQQREMGVRGLTLHWVPLVGACLLDRGCQALGPGY